MAKLGWCLEAVGGPGVGWVMWREVWERLGAAPRVGEVGGGGEAQIPRRKTDEKNCFSYFIPT